MTTNIKDLVESIGKKAKEAASALSTIEGKIKNKALKNHLSFLSKNKCLINKKIFSDEAEEVIFKSFSDILSLISGKYYPPRSKKIVNLIRRVKKNNFVKSTLGGCVIEEKDSLILISKEVKVKKKPASLINKRFYKNLR